MNNEDNTAGVRISNWTLATGTKPGARDVSLPPMRSTAARGEPEPKSSEAEADAEAEAPPDGGNDHDKPAP